MKDGAVLVQWLRARTAAIGQNTCGVDWKQCSEDCGTRMRVEG
jgi:hypothetical protein